MLLSLIADSNKLGIPTHPQLLVPHLQQKLVNYQCLDRSNQQKFVFDLIELFCKLYLSCVFKKKNKIVDTDKSATVDQSSEQPNKSQKKNKKKNKKKRVCGVSSIL